MSGKGMINQKVNLGNIQHLIPPFVSWIKMDFNDDGLPDYTGPYQLRRELATVQLDFSLLENRMKLGRALYHIAQRRGFKSSKGETISAQENDK